MTLEKCRGGQVMAGLDTVVSLKRPRRIHLPATILLISKENMSFLQLSATWSDFVLQKMLTKQKHMDFFKILYLIWLSLTGIDSCCLGFGFLKDSGWLRIFTSLWLRVNALSIPINIRCTLLLSNQINLPKEEVKQEQIDIKTNNNPNKTLLKSEKGSLLLPYFPTGSQRTLDYLLRFSALASEDPDHLTLLLEQWKHWNQSNSMSSTPPCWTNNQHIFQLKTGEESLSYLSIGSFAN